MRRLWEKAKAWLKVSNRWMHLGGGFAIGLALGLPAGLAAGATAEVKDVQWNRWDWKKGWDWTDFGITAAGAVAGAAIHYGVLWAILG